VLQPYAFSRSDDSSFRLTSYKQYLATLISFCRETHEKPYLEYSEGEALGVRKLACAFRIVNIINALKAAASLPHSKAPFGRELFMLP
jgi:hypothetical protein